MSNGGDMAGRPKAQKVKVEETLKTVRIPITKEGHRALLDLAKDEETSLGRLIVRIFEEKTGLQLLPEELREVK